MFNLIDVSSENRLVNDSQASAYWNDEALEKNKSFNVVDLGFEKIEASPKYRALLDQISSVVDKARIDLDDKNILSVASGTCWIEAQWLNNSNFGSLSCIDISRHRIHKLAPFTLKHYGILSADLMWGSVFDLPIDKKYDVVMLSQAFHHIEEPIRLLRFLREILSEAGIIFIVGEHRYSNRKYHVQALKHFAKYALNYNGYRRLKSFYPSWQDCFPPDFEKGDIHWSESEYDFIFRKAGFSSYRHDVDKSGRFQSYTLSLRDTYA